MATDRRPPVGFTAADLKTLRLLALSVGFIGAVLITMAGSLAGRIVAIVLTVAMMAGPTLAIYLIRRWRARGGTPPSRDARSQ